MSCFDKVDYKALKSQAKEDGVNFLVCPDASCNGVVIAYQLVSGMKMAEVAVSFCSDEDIFKKKHGKYQALLKLYRGESVQLPLYKYLPEELPELLAATFDI